MRSRRREVNPKAYKLDKAWPIIDTPYAAVLDDDTTISERNLRVAVAALERATYTRAFPATRRRRGVGFARHPFRQQQ